MAIPNQYFFDYCDQRKKYLDALRLLTGVENLHMHRCGKCGSTEVWRSLLGIDEQINTGDINTDSSEVGDWRYCDSCKEEEYDAEPYEDEEGNELLSGDKVQELKDAVFKVDRSKLYHCIKHSHCYSANGGTKKGVELETF